MTADDQSKFYAPLPADADGRLLSFVNSYAPPASIACRRSSTSATAASHVAAAPLRHHRRAPRALSVPLVDQVLDHHHGHAHRHRRRPVPTSGRSQPAPDLHLSGFVNGDGTGVVSGPPTLSTPATIDSPDGQHPIDVTVGTLGAADYDFTTVDGTSTVVNTSITLSPATLPAATVATPIASSHGLGWLGQRLQFRGDRPPGRPLADHDGL